MTASNLQSVLDALRSLNDHVAVYGGLSSQKLTDQMRLERAISDRVMFNFGWHAAKDAATDVLGGTASTDKLLPALLKIAGDARDFAAAVDNLAKANAKLAELNKPGRKKGSYRKWHFEPGYSVVVAMIETDRKKKQPDHVRWAVKEGWLDKDISDKTHLRRIDLILNRQADERARRLKAMGANVAPFPKPPRREPQKRTK